MKKKVKHIIKLLKRKKLKIALAESCTGGMLSNAITSVNGSSKIFTFGLVTYSNESKNRLLKVSRKILKKYGAVSEQCCFEMVKNLGKLTKNSICISITGIAGPDGGSKKKPVGLVYIGIKKFNKISINKYLFKNKGRTYIQKSSVNKALKLISSFI